MTTERYERSAVLSSECLVAHANEIFALPVSDVREDRQAAHPSVMHRRQHSQLTVPPVRTRKNSPVSR